MPFKDYQYYASDCISDLSGGNAVSAANALLASNPLKTVDRLIILPETENLIITYTVTFTNNTAQVLNDIIFSDTIPDNSEFVNGSISVSGVRLIFQRSGTLLPFNYRIESGVIMANIGSLGIGETATVVFQVRALRGDSL